MTREYPTPRAARRAAFQFRCAACAAYVDGCRVTLAILPALVTGRVHAALVLTGWDTRPNLAKYMKGAAITGKS